MRDLGEESITVTWVGKGLECLVLLKWMQIHTELVELRKLDVRPLTRLVALEVLAPNNFHEVGLDWN